MRRITTGALLAVVLLLVGSGLTARGDAGSVPLARYVVTLDPAAGDPSAFASRAVSLLGGRIEHVFRGAVDGYVALLPAAAVTIVGTAPLVRSIELDREVSIAGQTPSWALDRIDQRAPSPSGTFSPTATGAGVTAYVIDSGIRATHADFGGRVRLGVSTATDSSTADDCNGHGTHVAGLIGGSTWGVAKQVSLVAVRVLSCEGTAPVSAVVDGINWVVRDHVAGTPAVANLSLGGGPSPALDAAARALVVDGITVTVAAGNGNADGVPQDACTESPARVPEVITVGATDSTDRAAWFSNYGSCIDLYAPGVDVPSDFNRSDTDTRLLSGTSMAAPIVAGVAALRLQHVPASWPSTVESGLKQAATKSIVTGGSSPDLTAVVGPTGAVRTGPGASPPKLLAAAGVTNDAVLGAAGVYNTPNNDLVFTAD